LPNLQAHWKAFARQPYFDDQGVFISALVSAPLMLIMLVQLVRLLEGTQVSHLHFLHLRWTLAQRRAGRLHQRPGVSPPSHHHADAAGKAADSHTHGDELLMTMPAATSCAAADKVHLYILLGGTVFDVSHPSQGIPLQVQNSELSPCMCMLTSVCRKEAAAGLLSSSVDQCLQQSASVDTLR
jgi:hypothetical protein